MPSFLSREDFSYFSPRRLASNYALTPRDGLDGSFPILYVERRQLF